MWQKSTLATIPVLLPTSLGWPMPACLSTVSNGDVWQVFVLVCFHMPGFKSRKMSACFFFSSFLSQGTQIPLHSSAVGNNTAGCFFCAAKGLLFWKQCHILGAATSYKKIREGSACFVARTLSMAQPFCTGRPRQRCEHHSELLRASPRGTLSCSPALHASGCTHRAEGWAEGTCHGVLWWRQQPLG